jgi:hypothetical protein
MISKVIPLGTRQFLTRHWSRIPNYARLATAPLRILPGCIIIGAQKGGTSSLFRYLGQHPNIAPCYATKEPEYFSERYWEGLNSYRYYFPTLISRLAKGGMLIGLEGSPDYMLDPHAAARAKALLPDVKVIVLLRNPVDRAYSQWSMHFKSMTDNRAKKETLSFEEAVKQEETRTAGEFEKMLADPHYFSELLRYRGYKFRGVYAERLKPWLEQYPRKQMLILRSEDLYENPAVMLNSTANFLGISTAPLVAIDLQPQKVGSYSSLMSAAIREELVAYFAPHNQRLYGMLEYDFGWE